MLRIYTIYDHPTDYPDGWPVREFAIVPGGSVAGPILGVGDTLDNARALVPAAADTRLPRVPGDDSKIVETWV
jgi:hypothetical protein